MWRRVVHWVSTDVSEVHIASIFRVESSCHLLSCWFLAQVIFSTLKVEAICSSETSVDTQQAARRYVPEDGTLQQSCWSRFIHQIVNCLSAGNSFIRKFPLKFLLTLSCRSVFHIHHRKICIALKYTISWHNTLLTSLLLRITGIGAGNCYPLPTNQTDFPAWIALLAVKHNAMKWSLKLRTFLYILSFILFWSTYLQFVFSHLRSWYWLAWSSTISLYTALSSSCTQKLASCQTGSPHMNAMHHASLQWVLTWLYCPSLPHNQGCTQVLFLE
jgi:hypothetical protein